MKQQIFQSMSLADCYLSPDRIDIWQFSLAKLPEPARSLLNEEELHRANRFYFPRHQRRFSVARAMLKAILASYLDAHPADLEFSYNQYGKPFLNKAEAIEFNLSHSADLALLAIGQQSCLGVDLEFFSDRPYHDIAMHLFSPTEIRDLKKKPSYLTPLSFFHIWAQKEAFIKANGMGLSYPTHQFTVPTFSIEQQMIFDALHDRFWKMTVFMPQMACCAALCHDPSVSQLRRIIVDPELYLDSPSTN